MQHKGDSPGRAARHAGRPGISKINAPVDIEQETVKALAVNDGEMATIFFPPGSPREGGTCAFASSGCLEECLSYLEQNEITEHTLAEFRSLSADQIVERLLKDVFWDNGILEWNAWGDVLPELEDKIVEIITRLSTYEELYQMGFTRNRSFWSKLPRTENVVIHLTVDGLQQAKERSLEGPTAHPELFEAQTYLFSSGRYQGACGTSFCRWHDGTLNVRDCRICLKAKRGCFLGGKA